MVLIINLSAGMLFTLGVITGVVACGVALVVAAIITAKKKNK